MRLTLIGAVALGGALGSVARYMLSLAIQNATGSSFPLGTLIVNVTGAAILGFLMQLFVMRTASTPAFHVMLTAGFCGGYTTFSTFSYETIRLIEQGAWRNASAYVIASVLLSLGGVLLGVRIASMTRSTA